MHRSVGLDPSLKSYGWCVYEENENPALRIVDCGHEGTLSTNVQVTRFMHFRSMVKDILIRYSPEIVGIESPAYSAGPFQTTHHTLMMYAIEVIFEMRIDCVLFDPSTAKSLIRGFTKEKGPVEKTEIQKFVKEDTNSSFILDNNEADAYCIGKLASRFIRIVKGEIDLDTLNDNEKRIFLEKTRKSKISNTGKRVAHIFKENSRYFLFSKIPKGSVSLPKKSNIDRTVIEYLENQYNKDDLLYFL